MLVIDHISKLLLDFFDENQVKEIKKTFASLDSKKLVSYLQDASKPVADFENEGQRTKLQIDFLLTYANSVLSNAQLIQFILSAAESLKTVGEFEIASSLFDEIISSSDSGIKFNNIRSNCLLSKADIYVKQAKWEEALYFIKKAKKEFEKRNDLKGSAKCENLLGTIYGEKGNIQKAKSHFEKSLNLLSTSKDKNFTGVLEMNLGIIYSILGYFDESFSLLRRALIKFEQLQDKKRIAEIRHNLGMVFLNKNLHDEAIIEFDKCISAAEKPGYYSILGMAYLNKSYLYTQTKDFYLASVFVDRALDICHRVNDRLSMADIYKIKGIIERDLKNFKLSENYLLTSIRINYELSNHLNEAESLFELGILYTDMYDKEKAMGCFEAASKYFCSINSKHMIVKLQDHILQLA